MIESPKIDSKIEFINAFKLRTKKFALDIIRLFQIMPKTEEAKIIGRQLLRSATSVAANYRAACRARSKAEFFAKLSITVEEADETLFWLEILEESQILKDNQGIKVLQKEITEVSVLAKARKNTY